MSCEKALCNLDNTWEDCLDEFKTSLKSLNTWSCQTLDGVDKEVILSAPEIMDPKTDSGFGYQDIASLNTLLQTQEIPSAAELAGEEQLLDIMDAILAKELHYLEGYSLVQSYLSFPYFLAMDKLKEQNPVLYTYCRGVVRCLEDIMRVVFSTTVRSEEEFMVVPPELDRQSDVAVEEIMAELETAAAKASHAVAARLRFRKHFLGALNLFFEAKRRSDVEAAADLCQDALALLESADFVRKAEPVVDKRFDREKEIAFWVSVVTPTKSLPARPFVESMKSYKTMLRQLTSLKTLLSVSSLDVVTSFIEHLGAQQPLLPTRCVAVVVLFGRDPNESFLYGLPVQQRLAEKMAKEYGAPIYLRVLERDESTIESIIKYRIHKTLDAAKITPDQTLFLRQQTEDAVRRWFAEASKMYLVHLESMLCNRGLAHRRLMNNLAGLRELQEVSYATDLQIFLASIPGVDANREECIRVTSVLTLMANQMVMRTMELIVGFQFELDLLSQGEVLPALWYLNFAQRVQMENFNLLCLENTRFVPETRVNKKTHVPVYNLALTTRTSRVPDPAATTILNASRSLSDAVYLSACLMEEKGLIDLTSAPTHSLITVADTFNHRYRKCFGVIQSPPFMSYQRCMQEKPNLTAEPAKVPLYASKAGEVATAAADKMKALATSAGAMEETQRAALLPTMEGLERTARAAAASLASFAAICEDDSLLARYQAKIERPAVPQLVTFILRKKE